MQTSPSTFTTIHHQAATIPQESHLEQKINALLVGTSSSIVALRSDIIERSPWPSLKTILGESGTGKELIAEAIHIASGRKGALVFVNCATLSGQVGLSELFGHEKGAFTDAYQQRIGSFERADGGTIVLDEFGTLTPEVQAELLRVIDGKTFTRMGGSKQICTDVRIVISTNEDLSKAVQEGRFREDLYNRSVSPMPFIAPPLRERCDDIPLLVRSLIIRQREDIKNITGSDSVSISEEALIALKRHSWPGNVRELLKTVEACIEIMEREPTNQISLATVRKVLPSAGNTSLNQIRIMPESSTQSDPNFLIERLLQLGETHSERLRAVELLLINSEVGRHKSLEAAANALGINRTTLYKKLKSRPDHSVKFD